MLGFVGGLGRRGIGIANGILRGQNLLVLGGLGLAGIVDFGLRRGKLGFACGFPLRSLLDRLLAFRLGRSARCVLQLVPRPAQGVLRRIQLPGRETRLRRFAVEERHRSLFRGDCANGFRGSRGLQSLSEFERVDGLGLRGCRCLRIERDRLNRAVFVGGGLLSGRFGRRRLQLRRWKMGMHDIGRRNLLGRNNHALAGVCNGEKLLRKFGLHADAAMGSRLTGMHDALVHRHTRPGKALHEWHGSAAIDVRPVPPLLFEDREYTRWRWMPRNARGYQAARIEAVGVVEGHMLLGERDNREQGANGLFELGLRLAFAFHVLVAGIAVPCGRVIECAGQNCQRGNCH